MTMRSLPAFSAPASGRPANLRWDISPAALQRWDPNLQHRPAAAATGSDNTTISIMDVIGEDWSGQGVTVNRVSAALRAIGNKPITVEINSPGGDYFEGLAIYNALREHPKDVTVKVLGVAASAASVIAMAGDTIMVPRAGFLMIHNVWILAMGNKEELREAADWLEPFDAVAADLYAARSGLPVIDVEKLLKAETWMGGSDAVEKGFADDLLPSDEVEKAKNELLGGPGAAMRRIDSALAKGERLPRSERRKLINELAGKPSAAEEDDMPGAVESAVGDDGITGLRFALGRLKLAGA